MNVHKGTVFIDDFKMYPGPPPPPGKKKMMVVMVMVMVMETVEMLVQLIPIKNKKKQNKLKLPHAKKLVHV